MKIAEKIIKEAEHDSEIKRKLMTKVRNQVDNKGTRAARIMVQEAMKILAEVADPKKGIPNPMAQIDMVQLKESMHMGSEVVKRIKGIKESNRKK